MNRPPIGTSAWIAVTATAAAALIAWQAWPSIGTTWRAAQLIPALERQAYSAVEAGGALKGGGAAAAQCCGDCNGDGAVTVDEILTTVSHALTTCVGDGSCTQGLPASGQTTPYGPGSDGDARAGATLSYTDNGDGTITDKNTGLMWEKKDDSGGIHDKDNTYTWGTNVTMDGTMVTELLATLNQAPCFAGHCDWRIPNVKELQSIVDYEVPPPGPVANAPFHNAAGCAGCTDVTVASCSCTAVSFYWSSTTYRDTAATGAWAVNFLNGGVVGNQKGSTITVRAVRGGS